MADGDVGPFGVDPTGIMPGGGVLRYPATTPGAGRRPVSFWLDDILNASGVANTSAGLDPNGFPLSGPQPPSASQPPPVPTPNGTNINNTLQSPAPSALTGAVNNIHSGSAAALAAAHRAANGMGGWGQQISDAGAIEGGNPAVAQPVSSGQNPAPTLPQPNYHMPWPRAQVPPQAGGGAAPSRGGGGAPQGDGGPSSYGSPWDPQGTGYAAAQRLAQQQQQGSPWDPQGAGYAAAQRLAQRAPVQGPLAALGQQQNSPFTMVLRPNAPAESGGRGQGGSPLSTALDLSGYQPPPPAPPSYNLGYGGGGRGGPAPAPAPTTLSSGAGAAIIHSGAPRAQASARPCKQGPGFWADPRTRRRSAGEQRRVGAIIHGPGVGMPSPGPVNQPGFWGVHGRGVGFSGNQ